MTWSTNKEVWLESKPRNKPLEQREEQLKPGQDIDDKKQSSVDADLQIIVAQRISKNANDQQEVEPALEALQETTDRLRSNWALIMVIFPEATYRLCDMGCFVSTTIY